MLNNSWQCQCSGSDDQVENKDQTNLKRIKTKVIKVYTIIIHIYIYIFIAYGCRIYRTHYYGGSQMHNCTNNCRAHTLELTTLHLTREQYENFYVESLTLYSILQSTKTTFQTHDNDIIISTCIAKNVVHHTLHKRRFHEL